jgi:hypothetical protein
MSNGDIEDAQLEAILKSPEHERNDYLVKGVFHLTAAVERIDKRCAERGATCPAVVSDQAGKAVLRRAVDRLGVPVLLILATALITKAFG